MLFLNEKEKVSAYPLKAHYQQNLFLRSKICIK